MTVTSIFDFPMGLALFASVFADGVTLPEVNGEGFQPEASIECTEITLEYEVGIRLKSTKSSDCPPVRG